MLLTVRNPHVVGSSIQDDDASIATPDSARPGEHGKNAVNEEQLDDRIAGAGQIATNDTFSSKISDLSKTKSCNKNPGQVCSSTGFKAGDIVKCNYTCKVENNDEVLSKKIKLETPFTPDSYSDIENVTSDAANSEDHNMEESEFSDLDVPYSYVNQEKCGRYDWTVGASFLSDQPSLSAAKVHQISSEIRQKFEQSSLTSLEADMPRKPTKEYMRRVNSVTRLINRERVIEEFRIHKFLRDEEKNENYMIDKKTVTRMIACLQNIKLIQIVRITLQQKEETSKEFSVVVGKDILPESLPLLRFVHGFKIRYTPFRDKKPNKNWKSKCRSETARDNHQELLTRLGTTNSQPDAPQITEKQSPKSSGLTDLRCLPKFMRLQKIHKILFYLVWDYQGREDLDQVQVYRDFADDVPKLANLAPDQFPKVYLPVLDWRMFMPPIQNKLSRVKGWARLFDLMQILPLETFALLFNSARTEELNQWLEHPVKRYVIFQHLPPAFRSNLLSNSKSSGVLNSIIKRLRLMGLLQYEAVTGQSAEQGYVYVNQRTRLLDTRISRPGRWWISADIEYNKTDVFFDSCNDVDDFWMQLYAICCNTPLGRSDPKYPKEKHSARCDLEVAIDTMQITPATAPSMDNGEVHGNGKGAAGLDSSMFAHMKRNWEIPSKIYRHTPKAKAQAGPSTKVSLISRKDQKATKEAKKFQYKVAVQVVKKARKQKPLSRARVLRPKDKLPRKKIQYDEIDLQALARMKRLRVDWDDQEDTILLFCKVASVFLMPHSNRSRMMPSQLVRKILHRRNVKSLNKTSRACQRRINYILKSEKTRQNVDIYVQEISQDSEVLLQFQPPDVPTNKENIECVYGPIFEELVEYLLERDIKKSLEAASSSIQFPESLEELNAQCELIPSSYSRKLSIDSFRGGASRDVRDIQYHVIQSIIYSNLCSRGDKENYVHLLQDAYAKFSNKLLRDASEGLQEWQMITYRKACSNNFPWNGLNQQTFHFSIKYIHKFTTKYQYSIFNNAWKFMNELKSCYTKAYASGTHVDKLAENSDLALTLTGENLNNSGTSAIIFEQSEIEKLEFNTALPESTIVFDKNRTIIDAMPIASERRTRTNTEIQMMNADYEEENNEHECVDSMSSSVKPFCKSTEMNISSCENSPHKRPLEKLPYEDNYGAGCKRLRPDTMQANSFAAQPNSVQDNNLKSDVVESQKRGNSCLNEDDAADDNQPYSKRVKLGSMKLSTNQNVENYIDHEESICESSAYAVNSVENSLIGDINKSLKDAADQSPHTFDDSMRKDGVVLSGSFLPTKLDESFCDSDNDTLYSQGDKSMGSFDGKKKKPRHIPSSSRMTAFLRGGRKISVLESDGQINNTLLATSIDSCSQLTKNLFDDTTLNSPAMLQHMHDNILLSTCQVILLLLFNMKTKMRPRLECPPQRPKTSLRQSTRVLIGR